MPSGEELNRGFRLGDWEILPAKRVLRRGKEELSPEPKVFDVLLALARRGGDVVTNDELIEEVWDGRAFGNEVIQQKVKQLRGHLGDKQPFQYVGTVHRQGYRLLKPVELILPEGEAPPEPGLEARSLARWKTVAALIAAGFVALIGFGYIKDRFFSPPPIGSLAILPVENQSGNDEYEYIVEGVGTVVGSRISALPDFTVKVTSSPYRDPWPEVARKLHVDSLLRSSVLVQDDAVKIVFTVIRGSDGIVLHSGEVSGGIDDLFSLQERVARAISRELVSEETPALITLQAPDSDAYDSYMRGVYKLEHRFEGDNLEDAIDLFRDSIDFDEGYGPAYLGLATAYALLPDYRGADLQANLALAIETIETGVTMDNTIEEPAGAIYGFVYYQQKRWTEAEANYKRAVSARVVDSNAFSWYSMMLASVGRLEDSREMALAAERIDPDNGIINSRVAMVYTWLDDTAKAHEFFERANELHATGNLHVLAHALLLLRGGQLELSRNLVHAAVSMDIGEAPDYWIDPVFRGLADPGFADEGLAVLKRAYDAGDVFPGAVIVARTVLGDIDGALEVADELEGDGLAFPVEILFIPELRPLREHPQFMSLLRRLGVVAYWDHAGCQWRDDRLTCEH